MVQRRCCWRAVTRSSRLRRVAGKWDVVGLRVASAITSRGAEGGKASRPTPAPRIFKATEAVLQIATTPTANSMAVTLQLAGHLEIRWTVRRPDPYDHPTAKGQGLWR